MHHVQKRCLAAPKLAKRPRLKALSHHRDQTLALKDTKILAQLQRTQAKRPRMGQSGLKLDLPAIGRGAGPVVAVEVLPWLAGRSSGSPVFSTRRLSRSA